MMSKKYEMSMMGELKFFLGLQIRQQKNGTFISQEKYLKDCLKKFGLTDCKMIKTPMPTNGYLDADEKGKPFDQKKYRSMIGPSYIFVHLDLTLCYQFVYVLVFRPIQ